MPKDTIKAIRQAELKALETEKSGTEESSSIVRQAEEQAIKIIEEMTKSAREQANKEMKETEIQGAEILEKALEEAKQEIEVLGMLVKGKETAAVGLILSELIQ